MSHIVATRFLVTGTRHATDEHRATVWGHLDDWADEFGTSPADGVLVHGKCKYGGVDLLADRWARERGWTIEAHPEEEFGGPLQRNTGMVQLGATICLAFPSTYRSTGTIDCLTKALKAGIQVCAYPLMNARRSR